MFLGLGFGCVCLFLGVDFVDLGVLVCLLVDLLLMVVLCVVFGGFVCCFVVEVVCVVVWFGFDTWCCFVWFMGVGCVLFWIWVFGLLVWFNVWWLEWTLCV